MANQAIMLDYTFYFDWNTLPKMNTDVLVAWQYLDLLMYLAPWCWEYRLIHGEE